MYSLPDLLGMQALITNTVRSSFKILSHNIVLLTTIVLLFIPFIYSKITILEVWNEYL